MTSPLRSVAALVAFSASIPGLAWGEAVPGLARNVTLQSESGELPQGRGFT